MQIINKRIKGRESACPKASCQKLDNTLASIYEFHRLCHGIRDTSFIVWHCSAPVHPFKCLPKTPMPFPLKRCLSLDDRLIAVHVFLFLPALCSGCFLKLWRCYLAHAPRSPPPMKADPLRVTDLTTGGEWNDDCGNIF